MTPGATAFCKRWLPVQLLFEEALPVQLHFGNNTPGATAFYPIMFAAAAQPPYANFGRVAACSAPICHSRIASRAMRPRHCQTKETTLRRSGAPTRRAMDSAFGEINDFGNYLATGWWAKYVGALGTTASARKSLLLSESPAGAQ